MIKPGEIQQKAREAGVGDQQIEKDYMLSWIIKGVSQHEQLSKIIVFKGGTVLKKIYFEDYRFSEDLDFTLPDNAITNAQIFAWFKETFEYIRDEANILNPWFVSPRTNLNFYYVSFLFVLHVFWNSLQNFILQEI